MKYDEVSTHLTKEIPEFQPDRFDPDLPYVTAGAFAHFLLKVHQQDNMDALTKGLAFIERLYASDDPKVRELATIGYLEAIQNVWAGRGADPESILPLLGDESKKWWTELNNFWSGRIKFVGQSIR